MQPFWQEVANIRLQTSFEVYLPALEGHLISVPVPDQLCGGDIQGPKTKRRFPAYQHPPSIQGHA